MFEVVCWIKRAKRLGINVPLDDRFEKELMKTFRVRNHREMEASIRFLHDETFKAIIESVLRQRRKWGTESQDRVSDIYV